MRIGIGVVTCNRPNAYRTCIQSIEKHLAPLVQNIFVYNDGSSVEYMPEYRQVYAEASSFITVRNAFCNRGVATGKNWLLHKMMKTEDDILFLCEDDTEILSPEAVTAYVQAVQRGRVEHLNFAYSGGLNKVATGEFNGLPTFPNCVGAWSLYTSRVIKQVGYMDEDLVNAWEHVEHTNRIAQAGLTAPFGSFVDIPRSFRFLREQKVKSYIRSDCNWEERSEEGLAYMRRKGICPPGLF